MDVNLQERIKKLKQERNAVIVAHMYQNDDVQAVADMVGDSYALSKYCTNRPESTIVFCGVDFMAESAKILSPEKTVLIPVANAGCAMADMITAEQLIDFKKQYPGYAVAMYINSSAAVKAESDVIVTSSNALKVIRGIEEKNIIFGPDRNLGSFIAKQCPEKNIVLWNGFCPTHHLIQREDVIKIKETYPNAELLVHPECSPEVTEIADYAGSTKGIIDYAADSDSKEFIIGTEVGVMYQLKKNNPDKKFYPAYDKQLCPNMKKITLERVADALENMRYEVKLTEDVIEKANAPLKRMLEY